MPASRSRNAGDDRPVRRPEADVEATPERIEAALDQINYVADELESLSHLVDRVPRAILTTPAGDRPSVAAALVIRHQRDVRLLEATRENDDCGMRNDEWFRAIAEPGSDQELSDSAHHAASPSDPVHPVASPSDPAHHAASDEPVDLAEVLRESAATRRELGDALRGCIQRSGLASDPERRSEATARLYALIHADTDLFREIAYRLHAGPVTE